MKNNFLLDTHVFIWAMEESKRLSQDIKDKIINPRNKIFISVATVWEIVIKKAIKQIRLNFDIETSIRNAGFEVVPIKLPHALGVEKLPLHHRDPFDRVLISQAKAENLILITADRKIWKYRIKILRA